MSALELFSSLDMYQRLNSCITGFLSKRLKVLPKLVGCGNKSVTNDLSSQKWGNHFKHFQCFETSTLQHNMVCCFHTLTRTDGSIILLKLKMLNWSINRDLII